MFAEADDRTNDEDVVQLVDTIDLGQKLVDDRVMDSRTAGHGASRLTDRIYLIKDDDVQATVDSHLEEQDNLMCTPLFTPICKKGQVANQLYNNLYIYTHSTK